MQETERRCADMQKVRACPCISRFWQVLTRFPRRQDAVKAVEGLADLKVKLVRVFLLASLLASPF